MATVGETVVSGIEKVVDSFDQRKKLSYNLNSSRRERPLVIVRAGIERFVM